MYATCPSRWRRISTASTTPTPCGTTTSLRAFDYSVLDAAINSGVGRAPQWAGKALGYSRSSRSMTWWRRQTRADKVALIQKYWAVRLAFLHSLRTWSHFGGGWGRRCAQGEAAAVRMWLSVGAEALGGDAKVDGSEGAKAKTASTKAGTGRGNDRNGNGTTPAIDHTHFTLGGKIALGIGIAGCRARRLLIRKAIVHKQRADAYADGIGDIYGLVSSWFSRCAYGPHNRGSARRADPVPRRRYPRLDGGEDGGNRSWRPADAGSRA
jgi:hypothetical protein